MEHNLRNQRLFVFPRSRHPKTYTHKKMLSEQKWFQALAFVEVKSTGPGHGLESEKEEVLRKPSSRIELDG